MTSLCLLRRLDALPHNAAAHDSQATFQKDLSRGERESIIHGAATAERPLGGARHGCVRAAADVAKATCRYTGNSSVAQRSGALRPLTHDHAGLAHLQVVSQKEGDVRKIRSMDPSRARHIHPEVAPSTRSGVMARKMSSESTPGGVAARVRLAPLLHRYSYSDVT